MSSLHLQIQQQEELAGLKLIDKAASDINTVHYLELREDVALVASPVTTAPGS